MMREIIVNGIEELNDKGMIKDSNENMEKGKENDKGFHSDLKVEGFEEIEEIKHEPIPVHKGEDLLKDVRTPEKPKEEPITRVVERPRPVKPTVDPKPEEGPKPPLPTEAPIPPKPAPHHPGPIPPIPPLEPNHKIKNYNPNDDDKYFDDLCRTITDKVREQTDRLKEQQERLKLYDSEVERLQQIIKTNYTTVEEMKTDIKNKDEQIRQLETENNRLNEIIDSIQKSISPMLNTLGIQNNLK